MTDLQHHYKDRNPEETIQIITDFFKQRNSEIRLCSMYHSEIDTYSCAYSLYWHNRYIMTANGKGVNEIYSKASCYSELYERFCAYLLSFSFNSFVKNDVMESNKAKYGYYLYPNEKLLTKEEYLSNEYIYDAAATTLPNLDYMDKYMNTFSNGKYIGMPYRSILDDEKITYQDFASLFRKIGSTGLATGNTIEEALVQGCSEVFERTVIEKLFAIQLPVYYALKYENEYIKKLKQLGYEVYLYDLSYNFNMPVICLIIYHKLYHTSYIKLGSSPIFDIAVERCFTELYQGFCQMDGNRIHNIGLQAYLPVKAIDYSYANAKSLLNSTYTEQIFLDYVILNTVEKSEYNKDIFLPSQSYSNVDLLNHIKYLIKLNNLSFNWLDISPSEQIHTVHIVPTQRITTIRSGFLPTFSTLDKKQKQLLQDTWIYIYNTLNKIKNTNIEYDQQQIENKVQPIISALNEIDKNPYDAISHLGMLSGNNLYAIYFCKDYIDITSGYNNIIDLFLQYLDQPPLPVFFPIRDSRKLIWEQYQMVQDLQTRGCSKDYIKKILNEFNMEYIDFNEHQDDIYTYLFYLIYVKNFHDLYNSDEYTEYLKEVIGI